MEIDSRLNLMFSSISWRHFWKICLQIGLIGIQQKYGREEFADVEKLARVDEV